MQGSPLPLAALEALLDQSPSDWLFAALCSALGDDPLNAEALARLERAVSEWPAELCRDMPKSWAQRLMAGEPCPQARLCTSLWCSELEPDRIARLFRSPATGALTSLSMGSWDDADISPILPTLGRSLASTRIRDLDLNTGPLERSAVERFVSTAALTRLEHLSLSADHLDAPVFGALSPLLATIRSASFAAKMSPEALETLGGFGGLERLRLVSQLGDAGLEALTARGELIAGLEELSLTSCDIGDAGALALTRRSTQLRVLNLHSNKIGWEGAQALLSTSAFPELETLDLEHNDIRAPDDAAPALTGLPRLRTVKLARNNIGCRGAAALFGSTSYPALTELDLGETGIEDQGAVALAAAPWLPELRSLNMCGVFHPGGGGISKRGAAALARSKARSKLEHLVLSSNAIGSEGAAALLGSSQLSSLETLELRSCKLAQGVITTAAASSEALPALRSLHLGLNEIGDLGAQTLASSPVLARLHVLNLSQNEIGDLGAQHLASACNMNTLTALDLSHNRLGVEGLQALANAPGLTSLRRLELGYNKFGGADGASLGWTLPALRHLGLDSCELDAASARALAGAPCLAALDSLDLSGNLIELEGLRAVLGSPHEDLECLRVFAIMAKDAEEAQPNPVRTMLEAASHEAVAALGAEGAGGLRQLSVYYAVCAWKESLLVIIRPDRLG